MTDDDVLYTYRLQVLSTASTLGVAAACRLHGIHRSTYYRWKNASDRYGLEILRPRERRPPQMPNSIPVLIEHRIIEMVARPLRARSEDDRLLARAGAKRRHHRLSIRRLRRLEAPRSSRARA